VPLKGDGGRGIFFGKCAPEELSRKLSGGSGFIGSSYIYPKSGRRTINKPRKREDLFLKWKK